MEFDTAEFDAAEFDAAEFDAAEFDAAEFDADARYRLHERVALRPEPFGALAYHYGNRRLNFLRAPELVVLVENLGKHSSVREAFDSAGLDQRRWPSFEKALASLAASDFLVAI